MNIAKDIRQHINTISGKRRLTILNKLIQKHYQSPSTALRNVNGEYSPKRISEELSRISTYIKNLCANKGKVLGKYYSYDSIIEMRTVLASLAPSFEGISNTSSAATLRGILVDSSIALDQIKPIIGPFIELRFDEAVDNLTNKLADHHDALQTITDTAKEVTKQAQKIKKQVNTSDTLTAKVEDLTKSAQTLEKTLESQIQLTEEIHSRNKAISTYINKLQKNFEDKIEALLTTEQDMERMRTRIEEEYRMAIEQAREFEVTAAKMDQVQHQAINILNQAKHALNVSQGAGFLESYRELYENSSRLREYVPWSIGAMISFVVSIFVIGINVLQMQELPRIFDVFQYPLLLAQIGLAPIALFGFFFCLVQFRKKKQLQKRYHTRFAALETYLKLSDQLPYDSPEQIRTASNIMRYLEEDFNPITVRAMFNVDNQFNSA